MSYSNWLWRSRGMVPAALWACLLVAGVVPATESAAGESTGTPPAPSIPASASQQVTSQPAYVTVANRRVAIMRVGILGTTPADRAEAASHRVVKIVEAGGPLTVTTSAMAEGVLVLVDDRPAFRVLTADVDPEAGETVAAAAAAAVDNLRKALRELREAEDARALASSAGYTLLATLALALAAWLLLHSYRWLAERIHGFARRRMGHMLPSWTSEVVDEAALGGLLTLPLKFAAVLLICLLCYLWTGFVLRRFPYTRPLGEALRENLLSALGRFGETLLEALPGLLFVVLIFLTARIAVRTVRAFFAGIERGRIRVAALDETTARPTGTLVTTGIWLFALVAAYPYIPGSDSEAFKGIGVFVGLMMSIGASGIVGQVVSGLMLMYTRTLKPGEFVQIGETEGTVKSVGFVATRIETLRHEEVNIPNSIIASSVTRNYSRLAAEGGVWIPTRITIGYDTPWRQVDAMLKLAAGRTDGVSKEPAPRVRQTALQDFYVEYTLLVSLPDPAQRITVLDCLHANIQDVFNEFGVQIMSPNYKADPAFPKVVPKDKWFEPPAHG